MWENCGVVKNKELLSEGLEKIKIIKNQLKNIDVRIDSNSSEDLICALNLESALISSEATILSALARREKVEVLIKEMIIQKINLNDKYNVLIKLNPENSELCVSKLPLKKLEKNSLSYYQIKTKAL